MTRSLPGRAAGRPRLIILIAIVVLLLVFGRSLCSLIIDYFWWREMNQVSTWIRMSLYRYVTNVAEWLLVFAVIWIAHARGMKQARTGLGEHPIYARASAAVLAVIAIIVTATLVDGWVVARYAAGTGIESAWHDPVFGRPLTFYFFDLPFYSGIIGLVETLAVLGGLAYYLTARGWQIRYSLPDFGASREMDWTELRRLGRLETGMLQFWMALFLVALAASFWLDRFNLLFSDHGNLLTGIDYVQQHVGLPMQIAKAIAALLAAALILVRKRRWALGCLVVLIFDFALPPIVSGFYVKPNELSLEKPYLERHIESTRAAYALDRRAREFDFQAQADGKIDFARNKAMLDNVRLWDWPAFHDTLSQMQPLRPYAFAQTDVDRYVIDGQLRQVLLAPRELDLSQLGDARNSWINTDFRFTHGYGLVLAEASRITPAGLPELLIKDAPVEVLSPSLKLTRPEVYYSEQAHEPVFVHTQQPEFNYPGQNGDVSISYDGNGGFPIDTTLRRFVAAIAEDEWNIFLSNPLAPDSRMMIHRRVVDRLQTLASFIRWDGDPYLVINEAGRLVWIVDGYMTSDAHPYARPVTVGDDSFNYIRNSVKATVDAYDGTVRMYVFDPEDPMIQAYQRLFPDLFTPASAMPADLRAHTRAPEDLFRIQAEMYRTYHMREPEMFYNRADLWDLATSAQQQQGTQQTVAPTFMVATLPGEAQPEFLLTIPFTPRNKQNLIGMMVARCDGEHLGEIVYLQLPKQEIIKGPLQIEALVQQDQVISKDLTLWNQEGSQVLQPPILTLPIDKTFLFVAPLFIQAKQARLPQLEKVVLAVGNSLVYQDTYEQARAALEALQKGNPPPSQPAAGQAAAPAVTTTTPVPGGADARIEAIRAHFQRYKELTAQGRLAEAGKELEAAQAEAAKK